MRRASAVVSILLLPPILGCAAPQLKPQVRPPQAAGPIGQQAVVEEAALASAMKAISSNKSDYKITPADLLEITIYQEKELGRTARISLNGTISLPLIGAVKVGGLSLIEAETVLAEKLKAYLIDPQVTVFVKEYGNKKIYVFGEVSRPGAFELPPESGLTVLEAVSLAGGFTPIAARNRTKVIRTTPEGKSQSLTIEVSAITHDGQKQKDLPLEPNDVVYVPQSFF